MRVGIEPIPKTVLGTYPLRPVQLIDQSNLHRKVSTATSILKQPSSDDRDQIAQIYLKLRDRLAQHALVFSHDSALVEDSVQDLFSKLLENPRAIEAVADLEAYLCKAIEYNVRRAHRGELRRIRLSERLPQQNSSCLPTLDNIADTNQDDHVRWVREHVALLPERQREIIHLRFYLGLDYQEIEDCTSLPNQVIRNYVHRAMVRLRTAERNKE